MLRNDGNIQENTRGRERESERRNWEISHYGQCAWPRHTRQTVSHSLIVSEYGLSVHVAQLAARYARKLAW